MNELYEAVYLPLHDLSSQRAIQSVPQGFVFPLQKSWAFVRLDDGSRAYYQLLLLPNEHAQRRFSYLPEILHVAPHQASRYQEGLLITFGARKAIKGEDYERIRSSELKFRGKKAWPILRVLAPPNWPLRPNTGLLASFVPVLKEMSEIICQGALSEEWPTPVAFPLAPPAGIVPEPKYLERLEMIPASEENWLLDVAILPGTRIELQDDGLSVMQQVLMLASFHDEKPNKPEILNQARLGDASLYPYLTRHIEQSNRPASITVRDPDQASLLQPLCDGLGIGLIVRPSLPIIDRYLPELQAVLLDPTEP